MSNQLALLPPDVMPTDVADKDCWQTPLWLRQVIALFYAGLNWIDPCPPNPRFNALVMAWLCEAAFINPPFSLYKQFVLHGLQQPCEQVWIANHDHSTEWFQLLASRATAMCLLYDRVSFVDPSTQIQADGTGPRANTLFYMPGFKGDRTQQFIKTFSPYGICVEVKSA